MYGFLCISVLTIISVNPSHCTSIASYIYRIITLCIYISHFTTIALYIYHIICHGSFIGVKCSHFNAPNYQTISQANYPLLASSSSEFHVIYIVWRLILITLKASGYSRNVKCKTS